MTEWKNDWANYRATDGDGELTEFENMPERGSFTWYCNGGRAESLGYPEGMKPMGWITADPECRNRSAEAGDIIPKGASRHRAIADAMDEGFGPEAFERRLLKSDKWYTCHLWPAVINCEKVRRKPTPIERGQYEKGDIVRLRDDVAEFSCGAFKRHKGQHHSLRLTVSPLNQDDAGPEHMTVCYGDLEQVIAVNDVQMCDDEIAPESDSDIIAFGSDRYRAVACAIDAGKGAVDFERYSLVSSKWLVCSDWNDVLLSDLVRHKPEADCYLTDATGAHHQWGQPLQVEPPEGAVYYVPTLNRQRSIPFHWAGDDIDAHYFDNGLCFESNQEAAECSTALVVAARNGQQAGH